MSPRWKKTLKIIGISFGGLFTVVTAVGFCLPQTVRVERSIVVGGSPREVYPFIANFKSGWTQWNPFQGEGDAQLQFQYSGPDEGVGAATKWDSDEMGDGHMTITKADPEHGVSYDLMLMHDSYRLNSSLICEPAEGSTRVTWTSEIPYGANPYRRYLGLMIEKPLGDGFDKGLQTLKTKVEARAVAKPSS